MRLLLSTIAKVFYNERLREAVKLNREADLRYQMAGIRLADAESKTRGVMTPLQGIPGVKAEMINNVVGHQAFGLTLDVDPAVTGMSVHDVVTRLKEGDPPIWTRVRDGEDQIIIHVFGLKDGEDDLVGQRIARLFGR